MRRLALAIFTICFASTAFGNGLVITDSKHDVATTTQKIESFLVAKKLTIFAKVNHMENAKKADLELKPNTLLIFGSPKVGSPIMNASPTAGIDLPVKVVVYEEKGKTKIAYNDPAYLATRHGVSKGLPQIKKMSQVLAAIAGLGK